METARPDPGREAPEGYKLVARPEGAGWRVETAKRCRQISGSPRRGCGAPSAAAFNRTRQQPQADGTWRTVPSFWAYCPDHMFGRWVEDGQVMHWIPWPLDPCPAPGCLLNAGHDDLHDIRVKGDPVYARGLPQEAGSGDE